MKYRISSNKGPGLYFLPQSSTPCLYTRPATNRGRPLFHWSMRARATWLHPLRDRWLLVRKYVVTPGPGPGVYEKESVVRGHHIYKSVWTPVIGEELSVEREQNNQHDRHAVAVVKDDAIVGHMLRAIS